MNSNTSKQSKHFLQSDNWADFQTDVGNRAITIDGTYGYIHTLAGPFRYIYFSRVNTVSDALLSLCKKQGFLWARIEGALPSNIQFPKKIVKNRQPQTTLIRSLEEENENILLDMHKKTRYNIRLSGRKGVTVQRKKDVEIFWNLHTTTTDRDEFTGHTKSYYERFLQMDIADQFIAYYDGIPIASIITVLYGDTITYVHGASANKHRKVMAPYALQWEAMKYGKQHGAVKYDFWGIAPIESENDTSKKLTCHNDYCWNVTHPWTGITRFKVGFGGEVKTYPSAVDVVFSPMLYTMYTVIHNVRYGK